MRSLVLALAGAALCFSGLAKAADAISEPAAAFVWSGFYIGAQAGYEHSEADQSFDYTSSGDIYSTSGDNDGAMGGLYLGYNWQFASGLVLGAEADAMFGNNSEDGSTFFFEGDEYTGILGAYDYDWTAAARVRVGYAAGRFLPYIAGGVAAAKVKFGYDFDPGPGSNKGDDRLVGYTIGGGWNTL